MSSDRNPEPRRILVIGFEPFGAERRNPSGEIAAALAGRRFGDCAIESAVLPVAREGVGDGLEAALARTRPEAVVALGVAGGRAAIHVEQVAVNLDDYESPDEGGAHPKGEPIVAGGPDALLATLPVNDLVAAIRAAGVPAVTSRSAGTFLCNHVFYRLLAIPRREGTPRAVFLHLPSLPETAATAAGERPSMALETARKGVEAAIAVVARILCP